jgi:hypothetical protein
METWNDVFTTVILLIIALFGAPITQIFKNLLTMIFKKTIEDRWALLLTAVVAAGLAIAEQILAGVLNFKLIDPKSFPSFFGAVFTLATMYYSAMKNSTGVLGKGLLLKKLDA